MLVDSAPHSRIGKVHISLGPNPTYSDDSGIAVNPRKLIKMAMAIYSFQPTLGPKQDVSKTIG